MQIRRLALSRTYRNRFCRNGRSDISGDLRDGRRRGGLGSRSGGSFEHGNGFSVWGRSSSIDGSESSGGSSSGGGSSNGSSSDGSGGSRSSNGCVDGTAAFQLTLMGLCLARSQ